MNYQIINFPKKDLFQNENTSISDINIEIENIYTVGIDTLCKLESVKLEDLPIKNRKIYIKQSLSLLKYMDIQMNNFESDLVAIPQKDLIKIFARDSYVKYMKLLNELNIIYGVPYDLGGDEKVWYKFSKSGEKGLVKRYKLNENYDKEELCLVVFEDRKKIVFESDKNIYDKKYIKTIKDVQINLKSAIEDELNNMKSITSLRKRLSIIFSLYDKRYIKKGEKVDRIYHSLTNLSKISRKHLYVKDLKFNNIDIVNCQPLLLCYYLRKNNLQIDDNYIKDCENGNLYENFLTEGSEYIHYDIIKKNGVVVAKNKRVVKVEYTNIKNTIEREIKYNELRTEIKKLLYKSIFFDFKPKSDIAKKFQTLYPLVYSELERLNIKDNETKNAGRLQNIEAEIFNNLVPKKSKYYFTLFDAIYFTSLEDMGELILKMTNKFQEMGLSPKFKINE